MAVTVPVLRMVAAALVSFGADEPDVRLLIIKPTGTSNGERLPCVTFSQVLPVKLTAPQQYAIGENGNNPIPSSLLTE